MKGQREYRTKPCPGCGQPIGITWDSHFKCKWKSAEQGGAEGTAPSKAVATQPLSSGSPSDSSFHPTDVEGVKELFRQAKKIVGDVFEITEEDMNRSVISWTSIAQMVDSVFIELCRRNNR